MHTRTFPALLLIGLLGSAAAVEPSSAPARQTSVSLSPDAGQGGVKGAPPAPSVPAIAPAAPAAPLCSLESGVERTAPSSGCLTCHTSLTGNFDHGGHRVEVPYEPYGKDLRPKPEERGVNVVLPGGRITCLTCHDSRSKLPDHLAATTAGRADQRLCTACHLFD